MDVDEFAPAVVADPLASAIAHARKLFADVLALRYLRPRAVAIDVDARTGVAMNLYPYFDDSDHAAFVVVGPEGGTRVLRRKMLNQHVTCLMAAVQCGRVGLGLALVADHSG